MNAAETIRAAIERLENLRTAATSGPWDHQPYGGQNQNGDYIGGDIFDRDGEYLLSEVRDQDGALIVTLHRTIDAQLAILRRAEYMAPFGDVDQPGPTADNALGLARAILGEVSE